MWAFFFLSLQLLTVHGMAVSSNASSNSNASIASPQRLRAECRESGNFDDRRIVCTHRMTCKFCDSKSCQNAPGYNWFMESQHGDNSKQCTCNESYTEVISKSFPDSWAYFKVNKVVDCWAKKGITADEVYGWYDIQPSCQNTGTELLCHGTFL